jgi:hypothetical protein
MKKRQVSANFVNFSLSGTLKLNENTEGEVGTRDLRPKHSHPEFLRWLRTIMVIKLRKVHSDKFWRRSIQKVHFNFRWGTDLGDAFFIRCLARDPLGPRKHGPLVRNDSIRWWTSWSSCCKTTWGAELKLNFRHLQRHLEHVIYFARQIWRDPWLFRPFS